MHPDTRRAISRSVSRIGLHTASAGHLPPLVLQPDGSVHVLHSAPERLLRTDHQATFDRGATVLRYVEGIVERGRRGIDAGIAQLSTS
jgi:hypothetical protein